MSGVSNDNLIARVDADTERRRKAISIGAAHFAMAMGDLDPRNNVARLAFMSQWFAAVGADAVRRKKFENAFMLALMGFERAMRIAGEPVINVDKEVVQ